MSKKIAYIARATVPSSSTNSIHVAKIADAFASISEDFRLIVFGGDTKASLREVYGIRNEFPIYRIDKGADTRFSQIKWAIKAVGLAGRQQCGVIVTRDPFCAVVAVIRGMDAVLDLHGDIKHLTGRFYRMLKLRMLVDSKKLHLVTISQGLKDHYVKNYKLKSERITVLHDGADLEDFEPYAGKRLELNKDSLHIGYFGKILVGKGIDLIRRLAIIDSSDIYDIYGGTREDAEKECEKPFPENVVFHGRLNNKEIPAIMCDMDLLILPNQDEQMTMGENIGKFTSPLKLFEYMASGRCLLASDLPVIREVLSNNNSYLADSSDENDWAKCIEDIKSNPDNAKGRANRAKEDVKKYSWKSRAKAMMDLT